ncbi:hypothetical protein [Kutzneria sp. NPDC052558]|uniref:hypothetical protein n=1 Tax=Kutzneria sp. NPDC052558 TaxID=3364121 RepID=UPI0037C9AB6F
MDRLDRPWVARVNPDGTRTVLIRRGEVLTVGLVRRLQAWAAQPAAKAGPALPLPSPPRRADQAGYDVAGGAACATLPRIALPAALLRRHHRVVLTVITDRGPLVIGDQLTAATTLATAAGGPPVIGADESLALPAATPRPAPAAASPRRPGRQLLYAGRRQAHWWAAVAVLAVGSLWVADTFDDAPTDARYGVAEDVRLEAVAVVTHAPPQTWPRVTAY